MALLIYRLHLNIQAFSCIATKVNFIKTILVLVGLLCLSTSVFSQFQWEHTGGPEGLGNCEPFYNKDYAFLYDGFQLYRTGDGQSWEFINSTPFGNISVGNHSISIYTEQDKGTDTPKEIQFLFSNDNGANWNTATVPQDAHYNNNHIMLCSHGIYFKAGEKLYRSQSNGQSWKQLSNESLSFSSIFTADDKIWGRSGDKIYEFNSQSSRWIFSWNIPSSSLIESIHISDSYIVIKFGNKFFSSTNKGSSWTTFAAATNAKGILIEKNNKVYFHTGQVLRFTEKGNNTWSSITLNKQYQNYSLIKNKFLLFSSSTGCVLFDDTSNTYLPANQGIQSSPIRNLWSSGYHVWAQLMLDNSLHRYNSYSGLWSPSGLPKSTDPTFHFLISSSGKLLYQNNNPPNFFISTTEGITFSILHLPYNQISDVKNIFWIGDYIYLEGSSSQFISTDFGATWNPVTKRLTSGVIFQGQIWASEDSGSLIISSDAGISWVYFDTEWQNIISLLAAEDKIFVINSGAGHAAFYSSTDGISWNYSGDGINVSNAISGRLAERKVWKQNGIYYFQHFGTRLYYSADNCSSWEQVNLSNFSNSDIAVLNDRIYLGGQSGGGVVKSKIPRFDRPLAKGSIFHDLNGDGIKDPNENYIQDVQLFLSTAENPQKDYFTLSNQEGQFEIRPSYASNDTIRPNLLSEYVESIEPPFYITHDSIENYNFAVRFQPDVTDGSISGKFNIQPGAGKELTAHIVYQNKGTIPISGSIGLKLDPEFTFINAVPPPSEIVSADSIVWHFQDLQIFSKNQILVEGKLSSILQDGALISMAASILPSNADIALVDNHFIIQDSIVSTFIPNQKSVFPAEGMTVEDMLEGKELEYTIRFQNPYDHVVNSVQISDALATNLDYNSIRITGSSHDITKWELLPSGVLRVFFDNMNLAPNSMEDQRSQGFLSFAIRIRKDNNSNFNFSNKANIIFEKTRAVTTNTVNTKMLEEVISSAEEIVSVSLNQLSIIPNPASQNFYLSTNSSINGKGTVRIFNANGQVLLSQQVQDLSLDIEIQTDKLSNGIYLITAEGAEGIMYGKLIIQK